MKHVAKKSDPWLLRAVSAGSWASALSICALLLAGRIDTGHAAAPLNAPSHWLFGRQALRSNRVSWRHTLSGLLIHHGSSLWWGLLYSRLLHRLTADRDARLHPALTAVGLTALAAWVDFRFVPKRLSPGFEHRLSNKSLVTVYAAFAIGLAIGAARSHRRHPL